MRYFYTCDKQVLWESACAFLFRATTLVSARKSHSSGVRGLVVRCLLFNPEGSCSNPCLCTNFFTSIPKQKVTFRHYETSPIFGFVSFFSKIFKCSQRILPSICLIPCNKTNVKKSQRVLFLRFFGTMRLPLKFLISLFFFENFLRLLFNFLENFLTSPKNPPFNLFDILQQNEC